MAALGLGCLAALEALDAAGPVGGGVGFWRIAGAGLGSAGAVLDEFAEVSPDATLFAGVVEL